MGSVTRLPEDGILTDLFDIDRISVHVTLGRKVERREVATNTRFRPSSLVVFEPWGTLQLAGSCHNLIHLCTGHRYMLAITCRPSLVWRDRVLIVDLKKNRP